MSFPHLHVASGYSLRYGTSTPAALVGAAAAQGMDTLALTDRDGLYGAVKFALACRAAGIAPVLGVDLAVEPSGLLTGLPAWAVPAPVPAPGAAGRPAVAGERRTPVRGGSTVDPRHPRVTVLALGADPVAGVPTGGGWSRLCRLVSDTHLRGERGRPVADPESVAAHARLTADPTDPAAPGDPPLRPPWSCSSAPTPRSAAPSLARRPDVARAVLARWAAALPPGGLAVEVVCHHGPQGGPASVGHAARMLELARDAGVPAILTNAVRYVGPGRRGDRRRARRRAPARAARRAPPRPGQCAGLPGGPGPDEQPSPREVARAADDPARAAAPARGHRGPRRPLPARPPRRPRHRLRPPAREPRPRPGRDGGRERPAAQALRGGDRPATTRGSPRAGCEPSSTVSTTSSTPSPGSASPPTSSPSKRSATVRRSRRPGRRPGVRRRQPGQPPARHLGRRPDPLRPADGTVPHPAAHRPARHRPRRRVRPPHRGVRGDPAALRHRPGAPASR